MVGIFRLGKTNKSFVTNFVGLCVWKHMNHGVCWVKLKSLNQRFSPANVTRFNGYVTHLRLTFPQLWLAISPDGNQNIDCSKLTSFCNNTKHKHHGAWGVNATNTNGIYNGHYNMLS